ncbi:MarR family transcriptional regulator [Lysinibacillus xylanilyticus]|uniref:MarR family transcriptional regulator n=1 Tax=Lysinibacillus xylanilyticus TaxID=582475 RepID=UPI00380D7B5C
MTTLTLPNTQDTYKSLQSFVSVDEMNKAVKEHKRLNKEELTKATYAVLDFISQWSCKFVGVSYLCQKRIAESLQISYKTVQRAIAILIKLGVVKKYLTKRATGDKRQSSNIIVIQQAKENVHPKCPTNTALINTQNTNNTNDTEKEGFSSKEADKESLIKKGLVSKLPKTLQNVLSPFFDADDIYKLSGTIYKAKSKVDKNIQIEDYSTEYYESILSVINAYKRGRVDSLHGLLFHSIKATTRSIWLKERAYSAYGI